MHGSIFVQPNHTFDKAIAVKYPPNCLVVSIRDAPEVVHELFGLEELAKSQALDCLDQGIAALPKISVAGPSSLVSVLRHSSQGCQDSQRRTGDDPAPHQRVHLQPVVEAPRERPEAVSGRVMSLYRAVEVVRIILGPRLVGQLGTETHARAEDSIHQTGRKTLVDDQGLSGAPGDEIASRVLGCVEDYVRHGLRLVDRRDAYRLYAELSTPLIEEGCIYGPRHHLGHADRPSFMLELHPQRLQKAVYSMLGSPIGAVEWERALGLDRGDVDQGSSSLSLEVR